MRDSKITASVVLDSYCETERGLSRLITVQTTSPKFLDAEIEKHRMISSNSSSSRAMPTAQQIENTFEDPYIPQDVRRPEKGMQGYERIDDDEYETFSYNTLAMARRVVSAIRVGGYECMYHKQHINRYLEPFSIQSKVLTANLSSFEAMLKLRLSEYADPAVQSWAEAIKEALDNSLPTIRNEDEWHLPYLNSEEEVELHTDTARMVSAARCARVSYRNEGKEYDLEKEVTFANRLLKDYHMSPFEHQASPLGFNILEAWPKGMTALSRSGDPLSGNFKDWIQFRQLVG